MAFTWSSSSALASALFPAGNSFPIAGKRRARSVLLSDVPNELIVMLIVRRSASKASSSPMLSAVVPPSDCVKW